MNKHMITMTAQTPSFGMPGYAASSTLACSGWVAAKRVRQLGVIAADANLVTVPATQGAFPGTTAWRPPSC
ncbi:hypothetical protein [Nocardioides sp. LHG3406-4]|uniref:hypothetical protein n=1 Tax=Nocardioides sp. LHG3406-4 TaxID=2804575 RepID=UPI003CF0CB49